MRNAQRNARRLWRAVLFIVRLLPPCAWRRMLVRAHGGADRRPEIHPDQANRTPSRTPSRTERKGEALELVRTSQPIPVEWNESVAPDVANPAPPAGLPTDSAHPAPVPAPRIGLREEVREVLLRRALAADAPKWAAPSAYMLSYYARRAFARTGPILRVDGLMCIQATLPTAYVRAMVN